MTSPILAPDAVKIYAASQPLELLRQAQNLSKTIADEIFNRIKPGMRESQAQALAVEIFQSHTVIQSWHIPYIRFGKHTLLTFYDAPPAEDVVLAENDIAFIDIGPVFNLEGCLIEGDFGISKAFGNQAEYHAIINASKQLFDLGVQHWITENPSGTSLYQFLKAEATRMGYHFQLPEAGHLVGSFSHTKDGMRGNLSEFAGTIVPGVWILEVQLAHPSLPIGAFYEDVLA